MENNKPDWEIGDLYQRSWELIKKNKVLWIFGMAVSGFGLSNLSNFHSSNSQTTTIHTQITTNQFNHVSRIGTVNTDIFNQNFHQILSAIPASFYLLFILEITILIGFAITIGIVSRAWANAALIHAIKSSLAGIKPTIHDASEKAFANIKSLAWLQTVPYLILGVISFIVISITSLLMVSSAVPVKGLLVLLMLLDFAVFIYIVLRLSMSLIWAERAVILNHQSAKLALMSGYQISKRKFWSMLLLGLVNLILSGIVLGVPLLFIGSLVLGGLNFTNSVGYGLVGAGIILGIIFFIVATLLSGILTAFKASIWTIAYNNIKGKYE